MSSSKDTDDLSFGFERKWEEDKANYLTIMVLKVNNILEFI